MSGGRTRRVNLGGVAIGGGAPVTVQSMLKGRLSGYSAEDFRLLHNAGCDIMRFSILSENAGEIAKAVEEAPFPLVADIQGSLPQALRAIGAGCAGIRINPANFPDDGLAAIADSAAEHGAAVRIGVNGGSLFGADPIASVERHIRFFEGRGFSNLVVSIKSSDARRCAELNRRYSSLFDYPVHLGLTEAGPAGTSAVRSTLFFSGLLADGIGDTIRYSVAGDELTEVECGNELLRSLGMPGRGFSLVACPMCARHGIGTDALSDKVRRMVFSHFDVRNLNLSVAVMGCPVNGRGEAAAADVAVCAAGGISEIYEKGNLSLKVRHGELEAALSEIILKHIGKRPDGGILAAGAK